LKTFALSGHVGTDFDGPSVRAALVSAKGEHVRLELASSGGFVDAGLEIASVIRNYTGGCTCHIISNALSMASFIACAAQRVTAEASSMYMLHLPSMGAAGTEDDMRQSAEILRRYGDVLAQGYAAKCGKSIAEIRELMREETYLTAAEAKASGFIDEVIGLAPSMNSSTAKATARTQFNEVQARMGTRPGQFARVAAFLGSTRTPQEAAAAAQWAALGVNAEDIPYFEKAGFTPQEVSGLKPSLRRALFGIK
jgi:ATP-dependent protease ClpP protease subunit